MKLEPNLFLLNPSQNFISVIFTFFFFPLIFFYFPPDLHYPSIFNSFFFLPFSGGKFDCIQISSLLSKLLTRTLIRIIGLLSLIGYILFVIIYTYNIFIAVVFQAFVIQFHSFPKKT